MAPKSSTPVIRMRNEITEVLSYPNRHQEPQPLAVHGAALSNQDKHPIQYAVRSTQQDLLTAQYDLRGMLDGATPPEQQSALLDANPRLAPPQADALLAAWEGLRTSLFEPLFVD